MKTRRNNRRGRAKKNIGGGNPKQVYFMSGHGCDELDEKLVPEGCVYVTFKECGLFAMAENDPKNPTYIFFKMFSENNPLLKDPVNNYAKLKEIFGRTLHIHYPEAEHEENRTYTDVEYTTFMNWNSSADFPHPRACRSGLFKLGTNLFFEDGSFFKLFKQKFRSNDTIELISKDEMETVFTDSDPELYTDTLNQLFDVSAGSTLQLYSTVSNTFGSSKVSQSNLFEARPGIYYNFVCRSLCETKNSPDLDHVLKGMRRRQKSSRWLT
jgi:hypothetical protein